MISYCVVVFLLGSVIAIEPPIVKTNLGGVQGYHRKSFDGRTFSAFEGVPYAKPPVGELRFEAPVDPDPWTETLDAQTIYECSQLNLLTRTIHGAEDCLYLNVYVPKEIPNPNDNLDVIVHIHGGGFLSGSPKLGGPVFFMDREVVFVNFNYRLGPFGFLSTEDDVVPGNNGMKDQVLALRWIQNNIKLFGGNPKSVTITGGSAGSGSVHLHYLSKLTKGLFHRGVSQSGTALAPWVIQEASLKNAKTLGVMTGCDDTTSSILIDCLKTKPVEDILKNTKKMSTVSGDILVIQFTPVVEKSSSSAFLEDYPHKLLSDHKFHDLPWITSVCTDEGGVALFVLYKDLDTLDTKFDSLVPYLLNYNHTTCDSDKNYIAQALRQHYFQGKEINKQSYRQLMKLYGDRFFNVNLEKSIRLQASAGKSKVYSYIYGYANSFVGELNKILGFSDLDLGVGHVEDAHLMYDLKFFGDMVINSVLSEEDKFVKNKLLDLFTSFAKGDDPTYDGVLLKPVDSSQNQFTYLSIKGPTNNKIEVTDQLSPSEFWDSLPIVEHKKFDQSSCTKETLKTEL